MAGAVGVGVGQAVGTELGLNDPSFSSRSWGEQFNARLTAGLAAATTAAIAKGGKVAVQRE